MGEMTQTDAGRVREVAAEGWIYGYPLLENYRTMYPQAINAEDPRFTGGFGRFRHYSEPFTPENTDVVTHGRRLTSCTAVELETVESAAEEERG